MVQSTIDKIKGNWNQITGKVKEKYGEITDDDLKRAEGQEDQLVGVIQEKTGESKEKIKEFIDSL
jgi:uncharacterized protein YjbJ (UPF0337 family)